MLTAATISFFIKSTYATALGFAIGYERAARKKPAGLKTHSLLCLATCSLTHLSLMISPDGDPTRIAAQIVSGIGFIGAGTIFMNRQRVQGLTSAVTVFATAAVGMLVGAGLFIPAAISVSFMVLIFFFVRPQPNRNQGYAINIEILDANAVEKVHALFTDAGISMQRKQLHCEAGTRIQFHYNCTPELDRKVMEQLSSLEGLGRILRL